jgi:integrase
MATVNFYLKEPNTSRETLILAKYNSEGLKFKLSTGEKVLPSKWNEKSQRIKKNFTGHSELNGLLDSIEGEINRIRRVAISNRIPLTPELFKKEFSSFMGKEVKEKKVSLMEALDEYLRIKKDKLSFNYLRSVVTAKNHLLQFSLTEKEKLSFENISLPFYDKFTSYLYSIGQTNNTVGTNIARLKRFLEWATEMGYNTTSAYQEKGFKVMEHEPEVVYLTEVELFRIYYLDLSQSIRLNNVRDSFCFQCFTGLRFSDIEELKPDDVKDDEMTITIHKTREQLTIPLNDYSREILVKNNFRLPVISNQKTNSYLKELGELAEINDRVNITRYRGANRIEETFNKYELITTHTARRTFITLSLEKGMRPEVVMKITGHRSMKNFMRYVKITDKVKKMDMQRVWKRPIESSLKVI